MRSFAGRENQTECTFLQGNNLVQISLSCIPPDRYTVKSVGKYQRAVHDVLALQSTPTILLIFEYD